MRVADAAGYRNLTESLNRLNERLEAAAREVSTGKRLTRPQDSPSESAETVQLNSQLDRIDQYFANADNAGFFLRVTESALNEVHNLATAVFTRGSAAANSFHSPEVRQTLAAEIRALRDEILSLANTKVRGRYLFSGSQIDIPAFSASGDTVSYQGDARRNTIQISDGLSVEQNIPGTDVFTGFFDRIEQLLTSIESGDEAAIRDSLAQFEGRFSGLGQIRTRLGVELGKVEAA
ncbi:MAG: flagellar hook-associated protein 3, partial [Acidobacteria bacterium]|nr:flagellar hook-associated protein 3 [Acidobacteriota bacterium]